MGIRDWNGCRSRSIRLGRSDAADGDEEAHLWLKFWRKIKRQKKNKKKGSSTSPVPLQASYDQDSYLQNFDDGCGRMDLDNLYRSFSARFADPSRTFHRNGMLNLLH